LRCRRRYLPTAKVQYKDGTKPTVDQMATDVAAFLVWTAEPKLEKRHQTGLAGGPVPALRTVLGNSPTATSGDHEALRPRQTG
jgi:hypothetical protein